MVVFDCDLSPSQVRNIEAALGVQVLDRTGVIIEIFSRHAKTRAAQLQVEIARQTYLAPRLREMGVGKERHAGRGSGESGLEMERRKIRDRMADLKRELQAVQKEEENRRSQRSEQLCVALVGYTNAGKSSLMRALTGSEVLVEDKLFATLDTTVRALQPETQPRILLSDTVALSTSFPMISWLPFGPLWMKRAVLRCFFMWWMLSIRAFALNWKSSEKSCAKSEPKNPLSPPSQQVRLSQRGAETESKRGVSGLNSDFNPQSRRHPGLA